MRQIAADFEWWFTGVGIFGGKGALSAAQGTWLQWREGRKPSHRVSDALTAPHTPDESGAGVVQIQ
ncbi:hypothetical protein, partial [Thiolapillus sp.]|uniref:hypothetical protein n=1 Tax=Thiolapillus sp. TaxID=2017437 RepID=UPI003AF5CD23